MASYILISIISVLVTIGIVFLLIRLGSVNQLYKVKASEYTALLNHTILIETQRKSAQEQLENVQEWIKQFEGKTVLAALNETQLSHLAHQIVLGLADKQSIKKEFLN